MRSLVVLSLIVVTGCVHAGKDADEPQLTGTEGAPEHQEASTELDASCPTPSTEVDPAICAELPEEYGLSKEQPLEWGAAATGNFYFGRLVCPDGSPAIAKRNGLIGKAPNPSSSPLSPLGKRGQDLLDSWDVSCGDQLLVLYANMYRCGNPCPPHPLRLEAAAASEAYQRSQALEREGDLEGALREAMVAQTEDAGSLRTHIRAVYLSMKSENYDAALEASRAGLEVLPENDNLHLYRMLSLIRLERWSDALASADSLLGRYAPDDADAGVVLCGKAQSLRGLGRMEEAEAVRAQSCERGFKGCCKKDDASAP